MNPIVSNLFYIPSANGAHRRLRSELTILPKTYELQEQKRIRLYSEEKRGYLGIPIEFAKRNPQYWRRAGKVEDRRTMGEKLATSCALPDPNHPAVKNPKAQAALMRDMEDGIRSHDRLIAKAPTGSGKTVCALRTAAVFGRATLILVNAVELGYQWIDEIKKHLKVPASRIGFVGDGKRDYEKKDFVIGIVQSIYDRKYEPGFYSRFGFVIYDEVHVFGAEKFSKCCSLFPTRYHLGLSATPFRKDGSDAVYFHHLGDVRAEMRDQALPATVYGLFYDCGKRIGGENRAWLIKGLAHDWKRNRMVAQWAKSMYDKGRNVLVVTHNIDHIEAIRKCALEAGIPEEATGLLTRQRTIHPEGGEPRRVKVKSEEINEVKKNAQVIFATYGMCKQGLDIPRLDAGIEASPNADSVQLIGRIRRPVPGKKTPIWYTVVDVRSEVFKGYYRARKKKWLQENCEIIEYDLKLNRIIRREKPIKGKR